MAPNQKIFKAFQTRRMTFSSAHRLYSPHFSEKQNMELYDKCINTHGHNYTVEVTLFGAIDPATGMIMNMTTLKGYMEKAIMDKMDHKNIDTYIEFFKENPSTTENLAIFIWQSMCDIMEQPDLLYEVKLYETENNIVVFRGHSDDHS